MKTKKTSKKPIVTVHDVDVTGATGFGSSAFKKLIACPRRFVAERDFAGDDAGRSDDNMDRGSLIHRLIFGYWKRRSVEVDSTLKADLDSISTKASVRAIADRAFAAWRGEAGQRSWQPIHLEREFRHASGVTARVDGVFRVDDIVFVADVKTTTRAVVVNSTFFDLQAAINTWLVRQWCRQEGLTFGGFYHDRIEIASESAAKKRGDSSRGIKVKLVPVLVTDEDVIVAKNLARYALRLRESLESMSASSMPPIGLTQYGVCRGCPGKMDCRSGDFDFDEISKK